MPRLLVRNVPDVAVIQLGAEDIIASDSAAEPLTGGIVKNIERVILSLRLKNQKIKIVIVETLPVIGKEETSALLNHRISRVVHSSASTLSPVVMAETNHGFDRNQDMCTGGDFLNPDGATKMAAKLAKALGPLIIPLRNQNIPKP